MKPYFKFSLPSINVNPLEEDLWLEVGIYCAILYNFVGGVLSCPYQHGNISFEHFLDKKKIGYRDSNFVNLNIWDFKHFWSLILIKFFRPSVAGSGELRSDYGMTSQLLPLFCCCADHSQLSQAVSISEVDHLCALWNDSLNYLMYFMLPNWVNILLNINFHAFWGSLLFFVTDIT